MSPPGGRCLTAQDGRLEMAKGSAAAEAARLHQDKKTQSPEKAGLGVVVQLLVAAALVSIVALGIEILTESMLTSDVPRHMAARMFVPYDSYFYSRYAGATDRDRIAVVDLGKATLDRYHATWPLTYGQHARILERIRRARPRALFVDFQFQAAREDPSVEGLRASLCAFLADGIKVFLPPGSDNSPLRPELESLRNPANLPCFEKVSVGYEPDPADRTVWSYPLINGPGEHPMPSAALAMANAMREHPIKPQGHHTLMGLVWGSADDEQGPSWFAQSAHSAQGEASAPRRHSSDQQHSATGEEPHYCRPPTAWDVVPLRAAAMRLVGLHPDERSSVVS